MFATDPTLYGATIPHREFPFTNPYFAQWQQQLPYPTFGQQFPLNVPQGKFVPPMFQSEYLPQTPPVYGNRFLGQIPIGQFPYAQVPWGQVPWGQVPYGSIAQGLYNVPQGWQTPFPY